MAGAAPDTLASLGARAGASDLLMRYLTDRGITSIGAMSLLAPDVDTLVKALVDPLQVGFQGANEIFRLTAEELPIGKAILLYLRELCIESRQRDAQAMAAVAPPVGGLLSQTAAVASPPKVPTELAPGEWQRMIGHYNGQKVDARERVFPESMLLGADAVIARCKFEHEVSKQYSPLPLTAIMQARSFAATGELNPLAKRKKEATMKLTANGELQSEQKDSEWEARSLLSVLDGLTSLKWLFILVQIGDERDVIEYFDTLEKKARIAHNRLEQFKVYYETVAWRLAQKMRGNVTFAQAAKEVLQDALLWQDTMARDIPKRPSKRSLEGQNEEGVARKPRQPDVPPPPKGPGQQGGRSGGRGGGKGDRGNPKQPRWHEDSWSDAAWSGSTWYTNRSWRRPAEKEKELAASARPAKE